MNNLKEISVHSLNKKIKNNEQFLLIDVREHKELEISKISQAVHIPMNTIPENLNQISSTQPIIIMCKSGGRSTQVCKYLNNQGYSNVYNLKGGIINWVLEIDPTLDIY